MLLPLLALATLVDMTQIEIISMVKVSKALNNQHVVKIQFGRVLQNIFQASSYLQVV
jgi:hypothetical protein